MASYERYIDLPALATADVPGTPGNGRVRMYCKEDGTVTRVYFLSDDGTETQLPLRAATVTALTDNTAGTASDTLEAIPDPTDSPGTADALRDDLVAVHWPAIRNNFADLAAKINAIRTALRNADLMA